MTYTFFNSLMGHEKKVNLDRYPSVKHMYERISQLIELGNNSKEKVDTNSNAVHVINCS